MKVSVDYDICASTGSCMQVCPEVFEVRSDGYLYVLVENPGEELREKLSRLQISVQQPRSRLKAEFASWDSTTN